MENDPGMRKSLPSQVTLLLLLYSHHGRREQAALVFVDHRELRASIFEPSNWRQKVSDIGQI